MKKILLVQGDSFLLDMYKDKFTLSGFNVATACDGEEALEKIKAEDYDLLLLSVIMPKLNGFEVLRTIRKDKDFKKSTMPVIMLTSQDQECDVDEGFELGANDYCIKPSTTPSEIVKKVNFLLNQ